MSATEEKHFVVFFMMPPAAIDDWMKIDATIRAPQEKALFEQWREWTAKNASRIVSTHAGGKTKTVSPEAVSDFRNDITSFAVVTGSSHQEVANLFQSHPHLQIPSASIQVMETRPMVLG